MTYEAIRIGTAVLERYGPDRRWGRVTSGADEAVLIDEGDPRTLLQFAPGDISEREVVDAARALVLAAKLNADESESRRRELCPVGPGPDWWEAPYG